MADVQVVKVYRQPVPALRFIGIRYGDEDRVNGGFGKKWCEWFRNDRFSEIESQTDQNLKDLYEDGDAYIGLMRVKEGEPFQYWIGIFMPANTPVPEGYSFIDFPPSYWGVSWVYGPDGEVYCKEQLCAEKLQETGMEIAHAPDGACWFFERYTCPRFTVPDEKGNIILDICYFVK